LNNIILIFLLPYLEWLVRWCPLPEEKALMEELKAREAASSKKPMDTLVRSTPSSMTRDGKRP
jgi:hypothetical protein